MTTVDFKTYYEDRCEFNKKHGNYRVEDYGMTSDDTYRKELIYDDGAIFYEVCRPVYEEAEVEVKGIKIKVKVKLFCTEYWSTEFGSKYMYERY